MVFVSIVMESQHLKVWVLPKEIHACVLFWFQYCLSLQKILKSLCTRVLKGGGGGGGRTRHCTMHETLKRAHATFYAIAQRIAETEFAEQ